MILIPLTQGYSAKVDDCDAHLARFNWSVQIHTGVRTLYAQRSIRRPDGRKRIILLHQEILGLKGVDHRNGDGLDNRRSNLRPATHGQNAANAHRRSDNTSGFKGVCWDRNRHRWHAKVTAGGRQINLGRFSTAEEAAQAYDAAARDHFGEFARVNFPGTRS